MTTEEIVGRLRELIIAGENVKAEQELYSADVVSYEQDGRVVSGLEGVIEKTKASFEYFEESYGTKISEEYVGKNSFLIKIDMDVRPKGGERMQMSEYGFYKVRDGKIVEEHFFA